MACSQFCVGNFIFADEILLRFVISKRNVFILPVRKFLRSMYFMIMLATVCNYGMISVKSAKNKCQNQLNNRQWMRPRPSLSHSIIMTILTYHYNNINVSTYYKYYDLLQVYSNKLKLTCQPIFQRFISSLFWVWVLKLSFTEINI